MTVSDIPNPICKSSGLQKRQAGFWVSVAICAGTAVAFLFEYSGNRSFPGSLEARVTAITTNRTARIQQVFVKTGQTINAGDPLFQLVDTELEDRIASKRREISELEAELTRSKASNEVELTWRRRDLQAEIFEMQLRVAAFSQEKLNKQVEQIAWKERLSTVEADLSPIVSEVNNPFRSISLELQLPDDRRLQAMLHEDAAAAAAETLAAQILLCEQRLKKLETLEKEIEVKLRASSGVDVAETRLSSVEQEYVDLVSRAKELTIVSPTFGTTGEIKLQPGDRISNGSTLVEILDDSQPRVVALISSSGASNLHQGSKVSLVFPTNQRRIGIVSTIPPQTSTTNGVSESRVAVKIEPAGKIWPKIAIGSDVKVLAE